MSTATWSDLVATALLGTDRRPIPSDLTAAWAVRDNDDEDAATQILELAALHRSWVRAGSRLHQVDPPLAAPTSEGSLAGYAAQELLGRLLERPEPDVINSWLSVCADRGVVSAMARMIPHGSIQTPCRPRTPAFARLTLDGRWRAA